MSIALLAAAFNFLSVIVSCFLSAKIFRPLSAAIFYFLSALTALSVEVFNFLLFAVSDIKLSCLY